MPAALSHLYDICPWLDQQNLLQLPLSLTEKLEYFSIHDSMKI
jgi:hypothetical protein